MASFIQNQFERNVVTTSVDYVFNWARKSSLWPLTFGLACCAIEMIASSTSRFDIARFGAEVFRPSPRQSDLMIVAGTVTLKMAPVLKRIWDQMPDPKWCISMGACSSVGGPFNTYAVLQGVDKIVPVDVYVTGCPPRPENLFYGLLKLQDKIDQMTTLVKRPTEVRLDESMLAGFQAAGAHRPGSEPGLAVFYKDSRHVYRVTELDSLDWLVHGFGTRLSDIPARFPNLATLQQVAFRGVRGRRRAAAGVLGTGDALLENTPGAVVAVKTADCIPILLVDERSRAVAAVHAGWRGTVARIAEAAVAAMRDRFGSAPADLHAAIGPGIGKCCYEVGPEVAAQFGERGRAHIDLAEANRRQLARSGRNGRRRIYASNLCTMCRPEEFHSFRRDKEAAGRLYSFAGIR